MLLQGEGDEALFLGGPCDGLSSLDKEIMIFVENKGGFHNFIVGG